MHQLDENKKVVAVKSDRGLFTYDKELAKKKIDIDSPEYRRALDVALIWLRTNRTFYGFIIDEMVRESSLDIPTAQVCIKGTNVVMTTNPDFMALMGVRHRAGVIMHECLHIMNMHLPRMRSLMQILKEDKKRYIPLAVDLAVNTLLADPRDLPEFGIKTEQFRIPTQGKAPKDWPQFPTRRTFEDYMDLFNQMTKEERKKVMEMAAAAGKSGPVSDIEELMGRLPKLKKGKGKGQKPSGGQQASGGEKSSGGQQPGEDEEPGEGDDGDEDTDQDGDQDGDGNGESPFEDEEEGADDGMKGLRTIDDHDAWQQSDDEASGVDNEMLAEIIKSKVRNATQRALSRGVGAGDLQGLIDELLKDKAVNFSAVFQGLIGRHLSQTRKPTMMRDSKRYGTPPGRTVGRKLEILYFQDVSGSMADDEVKIGLSEALHAEESGLAHVRVQQFDWVLQGKPLPVKEMGRVKVKINGRGGTSLKEVIDMIDREQPDLAIICTDGGLEHGLLPKTPTPVAWILTHNAIEPPWGIRVKLPSLEQIRKGQKAKMVTEKKSA